MYHTFLIYSCLNGHFDCFQLLTMINNVAIKFMYKFFVQRYAFIFLGHIPTRGSNGSYGISRFTFWGTARLLSKMTTPFYIHISVNIKLSYFSIYFCIYYLTFWFSPSRWLWSSISLGFWFAVPRWLMGSFHEPLACLPQKKCESDPLLFLNWVIWLFIIKF